MGELRVRRALSALGMRALKRKQYLESSKHVESPEIAHD